MIVAAQQKSNLCKEEDVKNLVRSPVFQRKSFESLQKQQQSKTEFFNSNNTGASGDSPFVGIKKSHNQGNLNENQKKLISKVSEGLTTDQKTPQQQSPKLSSDGAGGGVYFMSGRPGTSTVPVGVFKPRDEENGIDSGHDVNGADKLGLKSGNLPGEGPIKEVAVYVFDSILHDGFFKVPTTTLVEIHHPLWNMSKKVGSLQEFVIYEDTAEEIGSSMLSTDDIHRIGLLDCLIFNCDRHFGNLLVVSKEKINDEEDDFINDDESDDSSVSSGGSQNSEFFELVPIDHSLCLPHSDYLSDAWFDWISYPQSKIEFSSEIKEMISQIDPDSDIQQLHSRLPKLKLTSLETLKITTIFLKYAIKKNLTLHQIGKLMSRFESLDQPSTLEKILYQTKSKLNLNDSDGTVYSPRSSTKPKKLYNQLFWTTFQEEVSKYFDLN